MLPWEHGRELSTISDGSTTWTNTYNADGLRTKRTDGTTTYEYIYRGSQLTQMTVEDDVLKFGYDANGSPMYLQFNNSRYFYATNVQGDVTALVHTSGTAVVEYTYDAWGNILTITGSMADTVGQINPLRYRGYVYDTETKLYYLQSRYYDPATGRFLNADALVSTGQGILGNNMFAYCNNNPVQFKDTSGMYFRSAITEVYINDSGDEVWYRPINYSKPSEFATKIDSFIFTLVEANSIDDYIEWYNDFKEFEELANPVAIFKAASGLKKVYSALVVLSCPIPSMSVFISTAAYSVWGIYSFAGALAEIVD